MERLFTRLLISDAVPREYFRVMMVDCTGKKFPAPLYFRTREEAGLLLAEIAAGSYCYGIEAGWHYNDDLTGGEDEA